MRAIVIDPPRFGVAAEPDRAAKATAEATATVAIDAVRRMSTL